MLELQCFLTLPRGTASSYTVTIAQLSPGQHMVHRASVPSGQVAFRGGAVAKLMFCDPGQAMAQVFYLSGECSFTTEDIADYKLMERNGGPNKATVRWPDSSVAYTCPACKATHKPEKLKRGTAGTVRYVSSFQMLMQRARDGRTATRIQQRLWCSPCFAAVYRNQPVRVLVGGGRGGDVPLYPDAFRALGIASLIPEVSSRALWMLAVTLLALES